MKKILKQNPKVLGLDVSTRTIGWALFDIKSKELLELTHISPVPKPKEDNKIKRATGSTHSKMPKDDRSFWKKLFGPK